MNLASTATSEALPPRPPRDAETFLALIAESRDRQAFASLFHQYAPRIKGFLARRVDAGTADELLQEVMLSIWRKAHQFDAERGNASTWIFSITRNTLFSHLRQCLRPEPDPSDPQWVPPTQLPDEQLQTLREQAAVTLAMGTLPPEQLQVIRASYMQGQSLSEVAQSEKLPLGTVKTRARLALARLRRILGAGDEP